MVPSYLDQERVELLANIDVAFAGAGRAGGVSWSEALVIDDYGTDEERVAARSSDRERSWKDLVDDPEWNPDSGMGGFSFLDAVGLRYYFAPAMVRCVRSGEDEASCAFHLTLGKDDLRDYSLSQWSALNLAQRLCIARFLRYMAAASAHPVDAQSWKAPLDSSWRDHAEEEIIPPPPPQRGVTFHLPIPPPDGAV